MFIHSFRLKNIWFPITVILLVIAIIFYIFSLIFAYNQYTQTTSSKIAEEKVVYLTFDDGPSVVTADILDLLKERNIKATFFVTGATTQRGKDLYIRMKEEGHSIGIHSYSHKYDKIYASSYAFLEDFSKLENHLKEIVGDTPKIFRFPGGSTNSNASPQVIKEIKKAIADKGYIYFDWNSLAKDDKVTTSPAKEIFENIIKSAKDNPRILILMHDNTIRTTAPDCVRMVIDYYTEKGYRFEPLTEDTPPIQFKPKK